MSVGTEISRLENAKAAIATAIAGKGVTVPNGTKLDGMAALIDRMGSVSTVNDKSPDESGNVALTAADIATSGGASVEAKLNTLDEEKQPLLTPSDNISITGNTIATKAFPCNPNLLDNWYFGNPVNQRGQTSYTGYGYGIDRWRVEEGATISLSGRALTITGGSQAGIIQNSETLTELLDKKCTFSALTPSGDLFSAEFVIGGTAGGVAVGDFRVYSTSDTFLYVRPKDSSPKSIKAVKLELGSQQTLAHQDANGNWVLNEIPDYGEQLRRCQRYLIPINNWTRVRASYYSGTALFFAVPIPSTMRTTPAILDPSGALVVQSVSGTDKTDFTFECNMSTPGSIGVRAAKNSHGLTDGQLVKRGGGSFQAVFFSSEL